MQDLINGRNCPKWAIETIEKLQRENSKQATMIKGLQGNHAQAGSPVTLETFDRDSIPLPPDARIRFTLNPDTLMDVSVHKDRLKIMAQGRKADLAILCGGGVNTTTIIGI
jgi:hypothetical protein